MLSLETNFFCALWTKPNPVLCQKNTIYLASKPVIWQESHRASSIILLFHVFVLMSVLSIEDVLLKTC